MVPGLTLAEMVAHREAWADLAARALEPNLFGDPAFLRPAARDLPHRPLRFLLAWDPLQPGRLIGLCCVEAPWPMMPQKAWLHPQATAAYPLLDADQAAAALDCLLAQTKRRFRCAGLSMAGLAAEGATLRLLRSRTAGAWVPIEARSRAVMRQGAQPLAGKAAKEFRRQARRLAEQGEVAVTVGASPERLERFLALERRGWKGAKGTALANAPDRASFVRDMVSDLTRAQRCRIYSLDLDGNPLAMGIVLQSGDRAFFWKTAFDEAYGRYSPGSHLAEAIGRRQLGLADVALTDSCAIPNHSMIDRLWSERMTVMDVFVTPTTPLSGFQRVALGIERARRGLRKWVKGCVARSATIAT